MEKRINFIESSVKSKNIELLLPQIGFFLAEYQFAKDKLPIKRMQEYIVRIDKALSEYNRNKNI